MLIKMSEEFFKYQRENYEEYYRKIDEFLFLIALRSKYVGLAKFKVPKSYGKKIDDIQDANFIKALIFNNKIITFGNKIQINNEIKNITFKNYIDSKKISLYDVLSLFESDNKKIKIISYKTEINFDIFEGLR